jgi:hypothetical protein
MSKASMPHFFYPKLHIKPDLMLGGKKATTLLWRGPNLKRVIRENNLRSKAILFQINPKTQVSEQEELGT